MSKKITPVKTVLKNNIPEENIDTANEQQLLADEKFINDLYNEVHGEVCKGKQLNDTLYTQANGQTSNQPSEILDKRIIKAAHRAINIKQPVKINKNSRFTWFNRLATAASFTLVVSLVVQQQGQILSPVNNTPALTSSTPAIKNDTVVEAKITEHTNKTKEVSQEHLAFIDTRNIQQTTAEQATFVKQAQKVPYSSPSAHFLNDEPLINKVTLSQAEPAFQAEIMSDPISVSPKKNKLRKSANKMELTASTTPNNSPLSFTPKPAPIKSSITHHCFISAIYYSK